MKYLPLRMWFIVSLTLALSAVIIRLIWEVTYATSAVSLALITLVILIILGIYALPLYLLIKPSLKKLKSVPVRISVTLIATAGLIDVITHFIRFVPSPEAASPLSVVIASLLLMAAISAYPLILWVIWSFGKSRIT